MRLDNPATDRGAMAIAPEPATPVGELPLYMLPGQLDERERAAIHRQYAAVLRDDDPLARFRAWYELFRLREQRSTAARLRGRLARRARAVLAVRHALAGVLANGGAVSRRYGVSLARQFIDQWQMRARFGIDAETYYLFRLHLPDRRVRAAAFLPIAPLDRLMRLAAKRSAPEAVRVVSDKRRFAAWCDTHGFPSVASVLEIDERGELTHGGTEDLPRADLFAKVSNLRSAQGARAFRYLPGGTWEDDRGVQMSAEALVGSLRADARQQQRPILLQRRLSNHVALRHLTNGALSTIRVLTLREPDGEPIVLLAAFRMGVGRSIADNLSQGGMASPVELATGRLRVAVRMNAPLFDECDEHPDTRRRISGTIVPYWDALVALATRAHAALPGIAIIGWDIAVTDDGPILVEANIAPSARPSQVASGTPLGETCLVDYLDRHLRRSFGMTVSSTGAAAH